MRTAKAQASLHICTVSPEPLLFAHTINMAHFTFSGVDENDGTEQLASLGGVVYQVPCLHAGYSSHHAAVLQHPH